MSLTFSYPYIGTESLQDSLYTYTGSVQHFAEGGSQYGIEITTPSLLKLVGLFEIVIKMASECGFELNIL